MSKCLVVSSVLYEVAASISGLRLKIGNVIALILAREKARKLISVSFLLIFFSMSFWPVLCIVVVAVEGLIGVSVNSLALIYLIDGRSQTKATYRVAMIVSTVHFITLSAIAGLTTMCHLFHDQTMFLVYFGLIPLLPQEASDVALVILYILALGVWEFTPAPCILQYLALCNNPKRLLIAYSVCLILAAWTVQFCTVLFADAEYRLDCAKIARDVFHMTSDEAIAVQCATLAFATARTLNHSIMPIALFGVLPSYSIAYVLFTFCTFKIYRTLNAYKTDTKSLKTLQLQRRFFKTLLLQGLLPLLVLSLPVSLFLAGVIGGFDMDILTLFLTFSLWAVPTVQGMVSLSFSRKIKPQLIADSQTSRINDSRMQ